MSWVFLQYVLNVTPDLPNEFEKLGIIKYLQIPITDHYSQDLAMHFPDAIQFIGECSFYLFIILGKLKYKLQ